MQQNLDQSHKANVKVLHGKFNLELGKYLIFSKIGISKLIVNCDVVLLYSHGCTSAKKYTVLLRESFGSFLMPC